jgi:hypothetical protein
MSEYMSAFETYRTYLAMNQHFTRKSYDYFKYNGKVKVNESTFLGRKDRYFFEKASKKFKRDEFMHFLLANYTSGSDHWIGNLMSGENLINMKKWKKRIDSLTYTVKEDILNLNDQEEKLDHALKMVDGKHPLLYRLYLRKKISLETLVILDDLVGYSKLWKRYDDMMLNDFLFLMEKYRPFLHQAILIDKNKFRKIILDIYS